MAKLHELLAALQDRKVQAKKVLDDTRTYLRKNDKFEGFVRSYRPFQVQEGQSADAVIDDKKEVNSVVSEQLDYLKRIVGQALDAEITKEETNASGKAVAELTVDGQSLGTYSAATFLALLNLLNNLRQVYEAIPTRDANYLWYASSEKRDVWQSEPIIANKTEKRTDFVTVAQATEHHPAQVREVVADKVVGEYKKTLFSGAITSYEKAELLDRLDTLIRAVKEAKSRANEADVKEIKLADKIFNYLHKK